MAGQYEGHYSEGAMSIRVGIVGVSGYGGGEVLRLCATHPTFELVYVAGEGSAGQKLIDRFPGVGALGDLVILAVCEVFTWHGLPARVSTQNPRAGSPCHEMMTTLTMTETMPGLGSI